MAVGQRQRLGVQQGVMDLFWPGFSSQQQVRGGGGLSRRAWLLAGAALAGGWALRGARAWDEALLHRQMAARYGEDGVSRLQAWLDDAGPLQAVLGRTAFELFRFQNDMPNQGDTP